MTVGARLIATVMVLLAGMKFAHAGFFGPFNDVPEPSTLSIFIIGGGAAAVVGYLKSRNRDK